MSLRHSDICSKIDSPYPNNIFDKVREKNSAFVVQCHWFVLVLTEVLHFRTL